MVDNDGQRLSANSRLILFGYAAAVVGIYFFSNPSPQYYYDYTFRVAQSFLSGSIGLNYHPPTWLNELIPVGSEYYSAFPLGAVLTMIPVAGLAACGFISEMPAAAVASIIAGGTSLAFLLIADRYDVSVQRRILMVSVVLFGTWTWVDLSMAGAWQLTLGFGLAGQATAIYFAAFDRRPLLAGICFALAFGNRTEILITLPVFLYLLNRLEKDRWTIARQTATFALIPFALGIFTLYYNYARFDSFLDFGYARIPGVLSEPWYSRGIFSFAYIPRQAYEMLLKPWHLRSEFPYFLPDGFSSSILLSSPFLFFLLRPGFRDRGLRNSCRAAIGLLILVYWVHGNSGGWQFGYRYAIVLLPWVFVALLENAPRNLGRVDWLAYIFSLAANTYALWLFHWTEYLSR